MRLFFAVTLMALAMPAHGSKDHCSGLLPADLVQVLEQANPEYRLPRESDNLQEDIEYQISRRESACLGVATADFDGNGQADYLIAMPAKRSDDRLIVVALRAGAQWKLDVLDMWPESSSRVFVGILPPGRFERTKALDEPTFEADEVLSMRCRNPAAIYGLTESRAVAYCRNSHRWQHVWISD